MFPLFSGLFPRWRAWLACALTLAVVVNARPAIAASWSFGIMADAQWMPADDGRNPNGVAVDIINQIQEQFIRHGVHFVVALGDLTFDGSALALDTRALYAQPLYNAGIGCFPLRGNHELSQAGAVEFVRVFPQTQNGWQNTTPVFPPGTAVDVGVAPVPNTGYPFAMGSNFSSPDPKTNGDLAGLSYSFDYLNARFVLLDQFVPTSGRFDNTIDAQQPWIDQRLSARPAGTHTFVFSHKGLASHLHPDTPFGWSPAADPAGTDAFIASMATNRAHYYIHGHDHMHDRTIVATTDGVTAQVHDLTCVSASSWSYTSAYPPNDQTYNLPAFGHTRETPLVQENSRIGFYICTIDGPRVTMDYYGALANPAVPSSAFYLVTTPALKFEKRETFGYSLNGREFLVPQKDSYAGVADQVAAGNGFLGTSMRILDGMNASTNRDGSGRALVKAINTGWAPGATGTASDVLAIWGLAELGGDSADTVALALSYEATRVSADQLETGLLVLASRSSRGNWVRAVDLNRGGTPRFVVGPWQPGYGLGAYGVDPESRTVWAVIDHAGDFAAALASPPPSLNVARVGENLVVSCAAGFAGYELQFSTNLSSGDWITVTPLGTTNIIVPLSSSAAGFFRAVR